MSIARSQMRWRQQRWNSELWRRRHNRRTSSKKKEPRTMLQLPTTNVLTEATRPMRRKKPNRTLPRQRQCGYLSKRWETEGSRTLRSLNKHQMKACLAA